jgi:hypothetical protein
VTEVSGAMTGAGPTGDAVAGRRAEVLGLRPELAAAHQRLLATIWAGPVSPVTLELCRLRMATLLVGTGASSERTSAALNAGLTEDRIGRLAQWPSDPSFSHEELRHLPTPGHRCSLPIYRSPTGEATCSSA